MQLLGEQLVNGGVVEHARADGAHCTFAAALEEADVLGEDFVIDLLVDVLKMDVVEPVRVFAQPLHRIHTGVTQMSRVKAKPRDFVGDVLCQTVDLVRELDVATRVWMDDGAYAPRRCLLCNRADVLHHAPPILIGEARRTIRMPRCIVALVMSPVHDGEIRCPAPLTLLARQWRQLCDDAADIVDLPQEILAILCCDKIVKYCACDNRDAVLFQFRADEVDVERQIAVGTEFDRPKAGFTRLIEYRLPLRQIGILHVVYAPTAGGAGDMNRHICTSLSLLNEKLLFYYTAGIRMIHT